MTGRTVTPLDKSFPARLTGAPISALDEPLASFSTPLFAIDGEAVRHNIATMATWTAARGLELMPHGKTTMAPELWRRQLEAGATGITVATGWQAHVALSAGVPTVQLANNCTDPALLTRLASLLDERPTQELVCWADSIAAVELLERSGGRIGVLVELGAPGGRTGVRDEAQAVEIARRVSASETLELRGVAGYEGALAHDREPASLEIVRDYCDRLAALVERIRDLAPRTPWASGGGSAYFDIVADSFSTIQDARPMLRSGAYLVHDSGFYRGISPLDETRGIDEGDAFHSAMIGYARVVSQPEPGLALLDAGKRDFPFDEGLPTAIAVSRELGGPERRIDAEVTALNDQHGFLRWHGAAPVAVGDVVRLGLSHPCTAFNKWRLVPIVENGVVTDAVETFF